MRPDETSIHDLVGAIYDGVADPALWQQALVQLSDATRSMGAMFIFMDRVHPMQSRYVLGRLDHDLMQVFLTHHADAPWTQAGIRTPPGTTFSIDTVVPARELIKTQFYGEILRPQQILHCGCAPLARDGERVVGLSVFRTPKIGPVESEDLRLLSLVAPHFKRAAQIAWRLGTLAVVDAAKTAALDGLDHGVLLIDAGGHVLFANRAAEAVIALRDGLTVAREGGLRAALPADTARLQTLIAETLRGSAGGTMRLTRPSLAEPFLLLVAPAHGNWHRSIDPKPAAVIFITALDQAVAPDLRLLAPAFDLTATEAKIAVSIAAGGGVPATARALRISPNTVHTHLRRIFRKLGVNDQAALVRVLMRAVAVLAANGRDGSQATEADVSAKPSREG